MRIDAHFHCWQLSRADYGWLTPALAPIYRDVSVADWQAQSAPQGVTGGVLVQAAATESETHFLLVQADVNPSVLGVVGWVDWLASDVAQRIERLAQHPKLKGLRPMLQDIADPQWILQPALAPALRAMSDHGLVLDALIKSVHLPHMGEVAQRHPGLRIVIDHGAKPDIAHREWQPWADGMAKLASGTQCLCKLSGLLTEAGPSPAPGAITRWADHILATFGAERVLWGSDWPVLELSSSYARWWEESQTILCSQNPSERAGILGENARRLYRL
jgi:L-fuconolactonase